jgi:hypothetical protein
VLWCGSLVRNLRSVFDSVFNDVTRLRVQVSLVDGLRIVAAMPVALLCQARQYELTRSADGQGEWHRDAQAFVVRKVALVTAGKKVSLGQ